MTTAQAPPPTTLGPLAPTGDGPVRRPLERRWVRLLLGYVTMAALLGLWQVAGYHDTTHLLPTFSSAAGQLWAFVDSSLLWTDLLPSAARAVAGFALGAVVATVLGVLIGYFRGAEPWTRPVLEFLRAIPPPAVLPLAVLALGGTNLMRVLVIAAGSLWPVLLNAVAGTREVEPGYVEAARVCGRSNLEILREVILPAALPAIMASLRTALGIALVMMVISEMIASSSGLGYFILQSQRTYALPQMYAGILLLGILGWLLTLVFSAVEHRVLGWYEGQQGLRRG